MPQTRAQCDKEVEMFAAHLEKTVDIKPDDADYDKIIDLDAFREAYAALESAPTKPQNDGVRHVVEACVPADDDVVLLIETMPTVIVTPASAHKADTHT